MPENPASTRLAAIDMGSNAIRLAIAEVDEYGQLHEIEQGREPVRLGADAFADGRFSAATLDKAVKAFVRFRQILDAHQVQVVRAIATSAMRDTANARDLIAQVREKSGIRIQVISGVAEAQLAFEAVRGAVDLNNHSAVLIDMGGGSVEVTVVRQGMAVGSETLPLGCVRLMQELKRRNWQEAQVEELLKPCLGMAAGLLHSGLGDQAPDLAVGTGGNLECLGKLRAQLLPKVKTGKIKLSDLDAMIPKLLAMSPKERQEKLKLRADRADVIAIAAMVLRMLMRDAGLTRLLTPGVGLKDGLLYEMAGHLHNDHLPMPNAAGAPKPRKRPAPISLKKPAQKAIKKAIQKVAKKKIAPVKKA